MEGQFRKYLRVNRREAEKEEGYIEMTERCTAGSTADQGYLMATEGNR
jgi:hypothetical protein